MHKRCLNQNHPKYARYGGRGITICERWLHNFDNFYADMGPRPPGLTLERKDNDQGYRPSNCAWETRAKNSAHTERNMKAHAKALENPSCEPWERAVRRILAKPPKIPYIPAGPVHGSKKTYLIKKCRCEICCTAQKDRLKKLYARRTKEMTPEQHKAKLEYLKEYRARKRNE